MGAATGAGLAETAAMAARTMRARTGMSRVEDKKKEELATAKVNRGQV